MTHEISLRVTGSVFIMEYTMKRISNENISLTEALTGSAYSLHKDDLEKGARLMAAAFHDDPSIRYLLGGQTLGSYDWRYFLCVLKAVYGKCVMLSDSNELRSLLILFPPTLKSVPSLGFMANGGVRLLRFFGLPLFRHSVIYENNCRRIKSRLSTPDTRYCMCLVVAPEEQGRGIGSGLLKPVLEILDKYHAPAYLETHKERNTRIYRYLGFDLADISTIPGTGIKQYAMLHKG